MKSKLVAAPCSEPKSLPYPKLMLDTDKEGMVVLFEKAGDGIVLVPGKSQYRPGLFSGGWSMCHFVDLPLGQSVVLENDGVAQ